MSRVTDEFVLSLRNLFTIVRVEGHDPERDVWATLSGELDPETAAFLPSELGAVVPHLYPLQEGERAVLAIRMITRFDAVEALGHLLYVAKELQSLPAAMAAASLASSPFAPESRQEEVDALPDMLSLRPEQRQLFDVYRGHASPPQSPRLARLFYDRWPGHTTPEVGADMSLAPNVLIAEDPRLSSLTLWLTIGELVMAGATVRRIPAPAQHLIPPEMIHPNAVILGWDREALGALSGHYSFVEGPSEPEASGMSEALASVDYRLRECGHAPLKLGPQPVFDRQRRHTEPRDLRLFVAARNQERRERAMEAEVYKAVLSTLETWAGAGESPRSFTYQRIEALAREAEGEVVLDDAAKKGVAAAVAQLVTTGVIGWDERQQYLQLLARD